MNKYFILSLIIICLLSACTELYCMEDEEYSNTGISGLWIKNEGQLEAEILYYTHMKKRRVLIRKNDIVFQYILFTGKEPYKKRGIDKEYADNISYNVENVYIEFPGADFSNIIEEEQALTKFNFFTGFGSDRWITDVSSYRRIKIAEIYPGADLIFDTGYRDVVFKLQGDDVSADRVGSISGDKKITYNELNKKSIPEGSKGMQENILWGTYLGGTLIDQCKAIRLDSENNAVIIGFTNSLDIPAPDGYDTTFNGSWDIYAAKMTADENSLLWATFIGGSQDDYGYSAVIDSEDNIIISGNTDSDDIPVINGYDSSLSGPLDMYICKLNPDGNCLLWATYLGGEGMDSGLGIVTDSEDNIYITGWTGSDDIPVHGGFDNTRNGDIDIYVAKISPGGNAVLWGSFLGGSGNDQGRAIALDNENNILITGFTNSDDNPCPNSYDDTFNGEWDIYAAKLSGDGKSILWGTYIGGSNEDYGRCIALDSDNNAVIGGFTSSGDIPVPDGLNNSFGGDYDAYLAKLAFNGNSMIWGSYIGDNLDDYCYALDTDSNDFVLAGISSRYQENVVNMDLLKISPEGDTLEWEFYFDGNSEDYCFSLAADKYDNILIAGQSASFNMPVENGWDTSYNGYGDIYAARLNPFVTEQSDASISGYDIAFETAEDEDIIDIGTRIRNNGLEAVESGLISLFYIIEGNETPVFISEQSFGQIAPLGSIVIVLQWDTGGLEFDHTAEYGILAYISGVLPHDEIPENNEAVSSIILPLEIDYFKADGYLGNVLIKWGTNTEYYIRGYNIYRLVGKKISPGFSYLPVRLNRVLIPASGSINTPCSYSFADNVKNGARYFYILESVLMNENTLSWRVPLRWIF